MNDSVDERLTRLERQLRLWRNVSMIVIGAAVVVVILSLIGRHTSPASDGVIRARGLVLADAKGPSASRSKRAVMSQEARRPCGWRALTGRRMFALLWTSYARRSTWTKRTASWS